jgi:hypothetical protein
MKKTILGLMFLGLCSTSAFAQSRWDWDWDWDSKDRPRHSMPEPSGLAELATCAVGLGVFAFRRRKTSV